MEELQVKKMKCWYCNKFKHAKVTLVDGTILAVEDICVKQFDKSKQFIPHPGFEDVCKYFEEEKKANLLEEFDGYCWMNCKFCTRFDENGEIRYICTFPNQTFKPGFRCEHYEVKQA